MYFPSRTPYGGPVPTPRDSAVANQLIDLEDWGGDFVIGVGIFLLVWAIVVVSFGVGRIRRRHFGVGNSRSGVGRLFLVWETALGVGH